MLHASNQVALLEPWFSNGTKMLVKTPKLYVSDAGLAAFLVGGLQPQDLPSSPLRGPLWETFVFSELRRRMLGKSGGWDLNFWRDRTKEVDFVFHHGGRFDLADAKWAEHPDARDAQAMLRVAAELPRGAVRRLALICRTPNPFPVADGVEALPADGIEALIA
jgi:hypothetical protein